MMPSMPRPPFSSMSDIASVCVASKCECRAVDVGGAKTGASVLGVEAALHKAESHPWRQVVDDDDAGGLRLDTDLCEAVDLAPLPAAFERRPIRDRRRHEQLGP